MLDCGKRDVHLRSSQQPIAQSQTVRLHHLRRVAMARAQARHSGTGRCCAWLKGLLEPVFRRRRPPPPPTAELGSTLLEHPIPARQRDVKAGLPAETAVEVPARPLKPIRNEIPGMLECLKGARADVQDIKVALEAAEEPKKAFFESAVLFAGTSGPVLCMSLDANGIHCEGQNCSLQIPIQYLEEYVDEWPTNDEAHDKALKALILTKYLQAPGNMVEVELLDEYMVSLARTMEGKNAIFWKVVTKTQEEIEFASGGQPGELVSVPMPHHFPLLIVPKEARDELPARLAKFEHAWNTMYGRA
ncbi:unnamed protein product [Durusdinium trenchii]